MIRLEGNYPKDLPSVTFGDSNALRPGELVLAIGAPFGLRQTTTQGIVSATGRSNIGIEDYEDFIQTDAPINPGSSGGPLIDMKGEVVGLNTAIATTGFAQFSGVGFAIPSRVVKELLPKLIRGEKIVRGFLGLQIQDLTDEIALKFGVKEGRGALIADVHEGSAADKAGLKAGDVVVAIDGKRVARSSDLRNRVSSLAPGTKIAIEVVRDRKSREFTATVGTEKSEPIASSASRSLGKEGDSLERLGISVATVKKGAVITGVRPGSIADFSGLRANDVIVEVDRKPVRSANELRSRLEETEPGSSVLFLVQKPQGTHYLVVPSS